MILVLSQLDHKNNAIFWCQKGENGMPRGASE
jgi:hypothetical protein